MTSASATVEVLRSAVQEAVPPDTSEHGRAVERKFLYVPVRHAQAISPDHPLVVGIRGAGKSVWWAALQSEEHRKLVARSLPRTELSRASVVTAGFGEAEQPELYPDKRTLRALIGRGHAAADVWRTIVAWQTWGRTSDREFAKCETWADRAAWLDSNPEQVSKAFVEYEAARTKAGEIHLVLFDAVDRSANEWADLRKLVRGLLELLLEFRSFRGIRAKAFLRPDMLDDPAVTAFPDSSKITANRVELRWDRVDLYSLFWQRLTNTMTGGAQFRELCSRLGYSQWHQVEDTWQTPRDLQVNEEAQREVFHELAGEWMGTDRRRGFPYSWLPSHLTDAADQVSPRSFLAALRKAAEESSARGGDRVFHYEAIKKGVQKASQIRVEEVKEDFFWVPTVMEPLRNLVIPCSFNEIRDRWKAEKVEKLVLKQAESKIGLPPKHLDQGLDGLLEDMLSLALFSRMQDGRINMPDVYRVGFGLGRKGGVKPIG